MKIKNKYSGLRDFFILWSSQAVSELGTAMTNFALIIWVYSQEGTAFSITFLTLCSFLPTILFRFIAGAIADRWNKKRIMLLADLMAACGTLTVLILYSLSALQVWHLYVINFLLSFMNAFQSPASYVATSLLVPKEHYLKVSGLQSFSGSVITILAPALGSSLLAFGGMTIVLAADLASFAVAFVTLLIFIKIPDIIHNTEETPGPFLKSCMSGINYLREHRALLRIILFFSVVNFLAKAGNDGMMSAFILGRRQPESAWHGGGRCFAWRTRRQRCCYICKAAEKQNKGYIYQLHFYISFGRCNAEPDPFIALLGSFRFCFLCAGCGSGG